MEHLITESMGPGSELLPIATQQLSQVRHRSYHWSLLYFILLYSTLLYFTLLYFTLLYFTLLYFTSLYFTLLYFTLLYFTLLYFTSALSCQKNVFVRHLMARHMCNKFIFVHEKMIHLISLPNHQESQCLFGLTVAAVFCVLQSRARQLRNVCYW
jgi:hypothetical protein